MNQSADFVNLARVETDSRLVEHQHGRIVNQCLGQPDALAITLRELATNPMRHVTESANVEYVLERLFLRNPGGPYGPGALGLSSFSPVLTGWTRRGPVAIHGTDRAGTVGEAVSNGCVRVRNEQMLRLLREVPAGTPVDIVN